MCTLDTSYKADHMDQFLSTAPRILSSTTNRQPPAVFLPLPSRSKILIPTALSPSCVKLYWGSPHIVLYIGEVALLAKSAGDALEEQQF